MMDFLVSYVIITMDRRDELYGCLTNIREQDYPRKDVVVVDNGSRDKTGEMIREYFPEVRLISLISNQGVAGGRNIGADVAKGEICIFLDDDARFVDGEATWKVLSYFEVDPKLACVAFRIQNAYTGAEQYTAIPRADKKLINSDYPSSYFCGAGFALKRDVLINIGKFWKELIYSGEELDLSYRLLDNGYNLIYASGVVIDHREVPSARPKGQWAYFNARNRCWVAAKNLPLIYLVSTCLFWWPYIGYVSCKYGHFSFLVRGIRDAILGLPAVLDRRRCIRKETVQRVRQLCGRLWY